MGTTDKRVDAYIAKALPFARPILTRIRDLVHKACPDVEETVKWGFPHFDYKGMMCSMAAFKGHCAMGFWKASLIPGLNEKAKVGKDGTTAMGHLGRLTTLSDLPDDRILTGYIREAAVLNEQGVKNPGRTKKRAGRVVVPADLKAALNKNPKAEKTFSGFSPSHKREYVEWITEAKTEETRLRRLATTIEWLAEGKSYNWKYMKSRR